SSFRITIRSIGSEQKRQIPSTMVNQVADHLAPSTGARSLRAKSKKLASFRNVPVILKPSLRDLWMLRRVFEVQGRPRLKPRAPHYVDRHIENRRNPRRGIGIFQKALLRLQQ